MIGTRISNTFTVAFFRSTITAATATVVKIGGIPNAFSKEDATELLIT